MAPPWVIDGVDAVPRRPRTESVKRKRGEAWAEAAKRVKLEDSDEDDQEQEALEALFSLAGGVPDFLTDQGLAARVKHEEPVKPPMAAVHPSSVKRHEGRIQRERRQKPSRDDDDRDWAPSKEPAIVRSSIATPKAVKANTSMASAAQPGVLNSPTSNVGLGMGLGAFAGPFPAGVNGSFYGQPGAIAAAQAASAAQSGAWPPPAPYLVVHPGGLRRDDVPEVTGSGQQDVLMPPQRRNWKRCASHVYIAHFIEYQLHCERIQKQQQAQQLASRLSSMDAPHASDTVPNGNHTPASAAALTERLGSGDRSGGNGRPTGLPKRVTPLPTSAVPQSLALPLGGGLGQGLMSNALALPYPQAASMALGSMQGLGGGQLPQPNGLNPQYAQQLQNQLLMQQGGSFPFLNPGMASFGGPRNGAMSAQQLLGFPFPGSAHMLGLAGFAALGQQLNSNGFTPPKSEMLDNMTGGDMAALKRAALVSGLKPEDAMKMSLSGLSNPEATTRLHALGVPPGLLSSARNSGSLGGPSFHEQLLAATNAQRPESQSVPLMRG